MLLVEGICFTFMGNPSFANLKYFDCKDMYMEQFYRVAKVAELLENISQSTVWLYTRQGNLKATKLSPKVTVWRESDIREFVKSQNDALNKPNPDM